MPIRRMPLVTGQVYHIVNRGVDKQKIFLGKRHYGYALESMQFYLPVERSVSLSVYLRMNLEDRVQVQEEI